MQASLAFKVYDYVGQQAAVLGEGQMCDCELFPTDFSPP